MTNSTVPCSQVKAPLLTGRPDFKNIMDEAGLGKKEPALVFACGPGMMVNGLWDECNARSKWKCHESRIDFHHETFEF